MTTNNDCGMAWGINEYPLTNTVADRRLGVYDHNQCYNCRSEWYEWASINDCITCSSGYYLRLHHPGSLAGTCISFIPPARSTLDIFVAPELVEKYNTGTYQSPFGHIAKALSYADDFAADKNDTIINIHLLGGGVHYMTRNYDHYHYNKAKSNQISYSQDITIQPVFWGQVIENHSFNKGDADCIDSSSKITVHYKMGNSYRFTVPRSLTVQSIIFDAIDSSIDPTDLWVRKNTIWCILDDESLASNTASSYSGTDCTSYSPQTEQWISTYGNSFFQFGFTDRSDIAKVGTLTVTSCEFQNFFYDFTSFVGLNNGHGHISITGSTFTRFSNCGSIIRDTREHTSLTYSSYNLESIVNSWRSSTYSSDITENKAILQTSNAWQSTECTSITISNSFFTDFNYLKSKGGGLELISSDSKMKHRGIILNLDQYYGNVAVYDNTFGRLTFKYSTWEDLYLEAPSYESDYIWSYQTSVYQAKTLIYINVNTGDTEIYGNKFYNCNSLIGLIFLERSSQNNNSPIFIHQNSFSNNSALTSGSNIIKLHLFTDTAYEEKFSRTDMVCASVQISSNTFSNNVGCFNTTGVVQAACFSDSGDSTIADAQSFWTNPSPMSKDVQNNLQTAGVVSFTTVNNHSMSSSSETMDKNKFMMKSNTFFNNFAGMT